MSGQSAYDGGWDRAAILRGFLKRQLKLDAAGRERPEKDGEAGKIPQGR